MYTLFAYVHHGMRKRKLLYLGPDMIRISEFSKIVTKFA